MGGQVRAAHLINATKEDSIEAVKKITGGGVNYSFEATGNEVLKKIEELKSQR